MTQKSSSNIESSAPGAKKSYVELDRFPYFPNLSIPHHRGNRRLAAHTNQSELVNPRFSFWIAIVFAE